MNDLYATCVAVYDGDKTILLISLDIGSIMEDKCDAIRNKVKSATKIPTDNIIITATHNHSSVHFGVNSVWDLTAYNKIANAAKNAIADLSDTKMFIGVAKTTGMAFVRRYIDANGNKATVSPGNYDTVELDPATTMCVTEADDTLQVVRFVREGKSDIVAANWQAHLAHAVSEYPEAISADLAHYMRQEIESKDDVKVIYLAGASGNINLTPPNESARKYKDHIEVGKALAKVTLEAIKAENLTAIEAGKINMKKEVYTAMYAKNTEAEIAAAKDRLASGERQEVLKDMLTDGFDRVFLLMSDKFYYQIQSLSELDGLSDEFKSRLLYGDVVGECKLTPWFVPLVNGLNEQDRDIVLAKAKEKMELDIETLSNRMKTGEIEVVLPADKSGGVLLEDGEKWRYIYPVDLTELVDCEAKDKLLVVFSKLKELH